MILNKEDEILVQSYFTTAFLVELENLKFLESEYFKKANFRDKFLKENLPRVGIGNFGSILMTLYTLLVLPKELLQNEFPEEFANLDFIVDKIKTKAYSNYKQDSKKIRYIRHIRNAVAHARVELTKSDFVFIDKYEDLKNNRTSSCTIEISKSKMGILLISLQKIFFKYIHRRNSQQ